MTNFNLSKNNRAFKYLYKRESHAPYILRPKGVLQIVNHEKNAYAWTYKCVVTNALSVNAAMASMYQVIHICITITGSIPLLLWYQSPMVSSAAVVSIPNGIICTTVSVSLLT